MQILESALLGEFICYIKSNWSAHAKVDQRRRRLRQLVSKVRAVVDAAEGGAGAAVRDESFSAWLQVLRSEATRGQEVLDAAARAAAVASSARRFLAGFKALFVCSAEVDRLADAVEQLELLAGPGGDLDMFVRVLSLDAGARAASMEEEDMDVDGRSAPPGARHRREGSGGCSCGCAGTVAARLHSTGGKRKRPCSGDGVDAGSTSRGEVDAVQPQKRLAWMRSQQEPPSGFSRASSSAPREQPPVAVSRSHRARTVALAMSRIRRRIGKPTTATRQRRQPSLGRQFSRISL